MPDVQRAAHRRRRRVDRVDLARVLRAVEAVGALALPRLRPTWLRARRGSACRGQSRGASLGATPRLGPVSFEEPSLARVDKALEARFPTRMVPDLDRIVDLLDLARRPAAGLPVDPHHRHQRQDLDGADDRRAAARAVAADRSLHLAASGERHRADLRRHVAAGRGAVRRGLRRGRAARRARRRSPLRPGHVLRAADRDGFRGLRRCAGRRRGRRGRARRPLGRDQRRSTLRSPS